MNLHRTLKRLVNGRHYSNDAASQQERLPFAHDPSMQDLGGGSITIRGPLCGLRNHGNTCYMNSVLQCLSNTDPLAEYFVLGHYKSDLARQKLNAKSKSNASRSELSHQLALLLKSLWTNQYTPETSSKFKQLVAKHGSQYDGNEQHDAQEFLFWLLDKVHEDLNVATKKKYKKSKSLASIFLSFDHRISHQSNGTAHIRSDDVLASETLANHLRCNSSFIHELFQAQLRSSLVCRACGKQSNTFDPYLCLSLPVPTRQTHTIVVNVTYLHKSPKEVKIAVSIESLASLRELRDKISRLIKVPERNLVLLITEHKNSLKELAKDVEIIQELVEDQQEIFAVETPQLAAGPCNATHYSPSASSSSSCESSSSSAQQQLILVWRNCVTLSGGSSCLFFGPFFSCQVSREASFKQIQAEIINTMGSIVKKGIDDNIISDSVLFGLRVICNNGTRDLLPDDVEHPLFMPCIDKALAHCEEKDYRGPVHLNCILEWDEEIRTALLIPDIELSLPVLDSNIEYIKARSQKANRSTLQDCFDLFVSSEKLAADNAWLCTNCRSRQQCLKKLSLWSLPDIFVIHLKRFRQLPNAQRSKLSTLVLFPLSGLDMNQYLVPRKARNSTSKTLNGYSTLPHRNNSPAHNNTSTLPAIWSPFQRARLKKQSSQNEDNIYDLYAVCNHHGTMSGGHYTAYCKNPLDGKWYSYDDTKVNPISEASVITADAYILFYQRSSLSSASSTSSSMSTSGYSSAASLGSDAHWALRISATSLSHWSPHKTSHSQDNIVSLTKTNSPKKTTKEETISRRHKGYSSLPSSYGKKSSSKHQSSSQNSSSKATKENKSRISSPPPTPPIRTESKARSLGQSNGQVTSKISTAEAKPFASPKKKPFTDSKSLDETGGETIIPTTMATHNCSLPQLEPESSDSKRQRYFTVTSV